MNKFRPGDTVRVSDENGYIEDGHILPGQSGIVVDVMIGPISYPYLVEYEALPGLQLWTAENEIEEES